MSYVVLGVCYLVLCYLRCVLSCVVVSCVVLSCVVCGCVCVPVLAVSGKNKNPNLRSWGKTIIHIAFLAPQGGQDEAKMHPRWPKLGPRCLKLGDDGMKMENI